MPLLNMEGPPVNPAIKDRRQNGAGLNEGGRNAQTQSNQATAECAKARCFCRNHHPARRRSQGLRTAASRFDQGMVAVRPLRTRRGAHACETHVAQAPHSTSKTRLFIERCTKIEQACLELLLCCWAS